VIFLIPIFRGGCAIIIIIIIIIFQM
jgi:hypothetical protein